MEWVIGALGFFIGLIFGVFIMGLCAAGKDKEDNANK